MPKTPTAKTTATTTTVSNPPEYKLVRVTERQINDCLFGTKNYGGCRVCGKITHNGCEPDARNYKCPECGKDEVFGLEELAVLGYVDVVEYSSRGE